MRAPVTGALMKRLAGVAKQRSLPQLAPVTFREWWRGRPRRAANGPPVLLWADTFNDHWQPEVLIAAVGALEHAGFTVQVPRRTLCCGRPLYDYGMLTLARRQLRRILTTLRPVLAAGIPIVGLEPSCLSVFKDELKSLFPENDDAHRLAESSSMLAEFLLHRVPGWKAPRLARHALVQGHCHHKAVLPFERDRELYRAIGLDADVLDAGCCGMAGGFGYEAGHHDVSIACGEHQLLPAVRNAKPDTVVIADGFSCREQIEQTTDRRALHTAQVLEMARVQGPDGPAGKPELGYGALQLAVPMRRRLRNWVALSVATMAVAALIRRGRR
jgi:Fe-S oxidoreductase